MRYFCHDLKLDMTYEFMVHDRLPRQALDPSV